MTATTHSVSVVRNNHPIVYFHHNKRDQQGPHWKCQQANDLKRR